MANFDLTRLRDCSRREFISNCALASAALASYSVVGCVSTTKSKALSKTGPAQLQFPLDQDWRFGGKFSAAAVTPQFDDRDFSTIVLPHCVAKLSWQNWDPAMWEEVWIYRRHFSLPKEFKHRRVFLDFDGVLVGAAPVINGQALPEHLGGYLPFHYEVTNWLMEKNNVLAVAIDSRWSNVPPEGNRNGPSSVDFLEPGGIPRSVALRAVPLVFISDVFAKAVNLLDSSRRVEVICSIDASVIPPKPFRIKVEMMDGGRRVASISKTLNIEKTGATELKLTLSDLRNVKLWDVDSPQLYEIVTTLILDEKPLHDFRTRIGLREARFELDGFFLNGQRLQLFGLNRHEIYPYVGFAMPRRVMRRDAEILRHELNCNIVRCSHYPQSEAFLDACDELGLLVWEEMPGWGFLGDEPWKKLAVRDVENMIRRDRNHPSIVIWGVRVNESKNDPVLYQRTTAVAKSLDDSRPVSGAMVGGLYSTKDWSEDVFAYNDYAHNQASGIMELKPPLPNVPYLLTEAVGQIVGIGSSSTHVYRRAGDPVLQAKQAIYHAQAHDQAGRDKRYSGVIAWCAFEYASSVKAAHNGVKYPGVADVFRIPKLGASFYQAQVSPQVRPVIQPNFYWDFGPETRSGPGKNAAIFSNCDRLEIFVAGKQTADLQPDRKNFPHLKYPPFFADLALESVSHPELRIDGYVGNKLVLSRSFSSDPAQDQFLVEADDAELIGDGADATRMVFQVTDKFGAQRLFAGGQVAFEISGPGIIVGDNPFSLGDSGGAGAIWIKAVPNGSGQIIVKAAHSSLGEKSIAITVLPAQPTSGALQFSTRQRGECRSSRAW
jgi:beta-galactosidase